MSAPKPDNFRESLSDSVRIFQLRDERSILRLSVAATIIIAVAGITFGLATGSFSIMFDGVYSLVDAGMSLLSLLVVNLIVSYSGSSALPPKLRERFTMGFWHLEPMVLALNGTLLMGVAAYAFINAISSLMEGGRDIEFGPALAYAVVTLLICSGMALIEAKANRVVKSEFVRLDIRGWVMTAGITAALLVAFGIGLLVEGTFLDWISPYIDPTILAAICLVIIPMPISIIRQALSDVFLVTPQDLKAHVDRVAHDVVVRQGFLSHRAYVARVGRLKQIELYFVVPDSLGTRPLREWDSLRDEIGQLLGEATPDRWLTISFTTDPAWAD